MQHTKTLCSALTLVITLLHLSSCPVLHFHSALASSHLQEEMLVLPSMANAPSLPAPCWDTTSHCSLALPPPALPPLPLLLLPHPVQYTPTARLLKSPNCTNSHHATAASRVGRNMRWQRWVDLQLGKVLVKPQQLSPRQQRNSQTRSDADATFNKPCHVRNT